MKKITQIILLFLLLPCLSHAEWTPLHQAARDGDLEQAQNLIDGGADVDAADEYGWTPLHFAAGKGREAIVQLLLRKRGAKIDVADNKGRTPLHWAAHKGHEDIVRLLLERGANINFVTQFGETPLHAAAIRGYEAIVRLLLEKDADVNAADEYGWTPLHLAKSRHHTRLITLLDCWQKLLKERKDQMYTFLLATHSPASPAVSLPKELSQHIWQFIKQPTIAELDQEIAQQEIVQQELAEQSNRSRVSNAWLQAGAAASAIAGLGILGYRLLKKR